MNELSTDVNKSEQGFLVDNVVFLFHVLGPGNPLVLNGG